LADIHFPFVQVEFASDSPKDPFQFPQARKWYITIVAIFYTFATSWNTGAYAVGEPSMEVDTGGTSLQAAAGLGVYAWGFAIFPLVLSSGSEEFGRKPLYVVTGILYWLFFFPIAK
jgi:MFS family permease